MSTFVGRRVPAQTVPVRRQPLRLPLWLSVPWWLLKLAVRLLLAVAGSPSAVATLVVLTLCWAVWRLQGPVLGPFLIAAGLILLGSVLVAMRIWRPPVFQAWVVVPLRSRWRRWSLYRHKWQPTMDFAGLNAHRSNGSEYHPVLLGVKSTPDLDRVRCRMLAAQTVEDWGRVADRLSQTFGLVDCRVRSVPGRPHEIEIWCLRRDPLTEVVQPHAQETPVRLDGLPVGLREDGQIFRLRLLGSHLLLVGETRKGKSNALWAIIQQLAPAIADGYVRLLGVDPKSQELSFGELLFHRLSWADPADHAAVLEEAVAIMRVRQASQRGITRVHEATPDAPFVVVLIDELGALTLVHDRDIKRRIDYALGLLLQQGAAVGVTVLAVVQDARKEVIPQRDLYPVRVMLRTPEADQVRLVMGASAYDRGCRADEIPDSLPGVAYAAAAGEPEPVRIRFALVTDEHIRTLVGGWRPPLQLVPEVEDDAAA